VTHDTDPTPLDQALSDYDPNQEAVVLDEALIKLAIFQLSGLYFAFKGTQVREILPYSDIFYVPGCPNTMAGVINLRGHIESVVRLDLILGLPPQKADVPEEQRRILILHSDAMNTGVLVDLVEDVLDIPETAIHPPLSTFPTPLDTWVEGELQWSDKAVPCLDAERLFADYRKSLGDFSV
jgi:purine-binding chemotaxis protein CheW